MKHSLNNDHITVTKKCTPSVSRKKYCWLSFHASHGNEVLRFSYKDHLTNVEVLAKIQQAVGPHEDRMTVIKKRKTAVVWTRLPFIGSGQNHLARHSEKGGEKETRQTDEEVGRQLQGMDRPGVRQVPEGSAEH